MRYDNEVYFQKFTSGPYNETTGNYGEDTVVETKKFASVKNTGIETLNLIYGEIRQDSMTIQLLQHYDDAFDRIRIGNRGYKVDFQRKLRTKHTFVVSEVQ